MSPRPIMRCAYRRSASRRLRRARARTPVSMSRPRSRYGKRRRRRPDADRGRLPYHAPPFFEAFGPVPGFLRENYRKSLIGEVAERSKALDWNASNISTGVRGFDSPPLRHLTAGLVTMVARIGFSATTSRESRQGRKAAAAAAMSGAGA